MLTARTMTTCGRTALVAGKLAPARVATVFLLQHNPSCSFSTSLRRHAATSTTASSNATSQADNKATQLVMISKYPDPTWQHPVYTQEQMEAIKIAHRETKNWSDWTALSLNRVLRYCFDLATGYKHDKQVALGNKAPENATQKFVMTPDKWMVRFIFLESIAGVPGMVAGMVRHLHSLRRTRRDNGWIETLFEEAFNERMHLLTFLKIRQPGWFMRLMLLGAQGVFFNVFFVCYLLSPRTCHRFVGYLEEEAVITYSRVIADLQSGKLPEWDNLAAPDIAIQYFKLKPDAKMIDVLQVIRADEAKHREVNHTLANLEQNIDMNPYSAKYYPPDAPRPTKSLETVRGTGWEREEVERMADELAKEAEKK